MLNRLLVTTLVLAATLNISGCTKEATDKTSDYALPQELSDCKIFRLSNGGGGLLYVVRCPLSSTTTKNGKNVPVTVIEQEPTKAVVAQVEHDSDYEACKQHSANGYMPCNKKETITLNGKTYQAVD